MILLQQLIINYIFIYEHHYASFFRKVLLFTCLSFLKYNLRKLNIINNESEDINERNIQMP